MPESDEPSALELGPSALELELESSLELSVLNPAMGMNLGRDFFPLSDCKFESLSLDWEAAALEEEEMRGDWGRSFRLLSASGVRDRVPSCATTGNTDSGGIPGTPDAEGDEVAPTG